MVLDVSQIKLFESNGGHSLTATVVADGPDGCGGEAPLLERLPSPPEAFVGTPGERTIEDDQ